jgi:hypothetical protein
MKKDLCEIVIVLDESGSMGSCKSDTIGGVNLFLDNQKKIKGEVWVTLVKFSDYYKMVNDAVPLDQVAYLNENNYTPSYSTALLDAVGKIINIIGKRLADTPETERPERVIFAVITDGYENSSREFTRSQVFQMVTHQKEKYSWEFIFLGADIDAWGEEIGITMNVNIHKNDLKRSFKGLSHHVLYCRMGRIIDTSESFDISENDIDKKLDDIGKDQEIN